MLVSQGIWTSPIKPAQSWEIFYIEKKKLFCDEQQVTFLCVGNHFRHIYSNTLNKNLNQGDDDDGRPGERRKYFCSKLNLNAFPPFFVTLVVLLVIMMQRVLIILCICMHASHFLGVACDDVHGRQLNANIFPFLQCDNDDE